MSPTAISSAGSMDNWCGEFPICESTCVPARGHHRSAAQRLWRCRQGLGDGAGGPAAERRPATASLARVGETLVAVDTLVHNFLHRTGILRRLGAEHPYGERCYRTGGCAAFSVCSPPTSMLANLIRPFLRRFHALCRVSVGARLSKCAMSLLEYSRSLKRFGIGGVLVCTFAHVAQACVCNTKLLGPHAFLVPRTRCTNDRVQTLE